MNPVHMPGNEPDAGDMSTGFDAETETGAPTKTPGTDEDEGDALGDFA